MTDKQKEAILLLNSIKAKSGMTDEEYFTLMDFIIEAKMEIQYVPQPTFPWTAPQPLQPYYGGGTGDPLQPPYRVTCEFIKD